MRPNAEVIDTLDKIDDSTLLAAGESDLLAEAYGLLDAMEEWEGIILRAPALVDPRPDGDLPVLVACERTGDRAREIPLAENAVVVCNRLDGEGRWVVPILPPDPLKVPMPPADGATVPGEIEDDGAAGLLPERTTSVDRVDLRAVDALPWAPGRYAVRVVYFDWVSNTAVVTLGNPQTEGQSDQEPSADVGGNAADLRAALEGRGRGTPDTLPNFVRGPQSPEPDGVGVALNLPATPVQVGQSVPAYGAVRLLAEEEWRADGEGLAAVMSGFAVLARRDVTSPAVCDLQIPIYAEGDIEPGAPVDAYFAYDLNALAAQILPAAAYQVYLVVGEHIGGPHPLTIADGSD